MASFNKVIILGNLTRDPELRVTSAGAPICKFGLASSRAFTTADGTRKEEVLFLDIDAFGRPAEVIAKYATKGKPLLVEGRLRYDQWEAPSGERRNKLTLVLESFQFVGAKPVDAHSGEELGSTHYDEHHASRAHTRTPMPAPSHTEPDEDIPF